MAGLMTGITRNTQIFCNSVLDLVRSIGVTEENIGVLRPKLTVLLEDFTTRQDQVDKELADQKDHTNTLIKELAAQKELTNVLIKKLGLLEKRVKSSVAAERRRDFNLVKNNVIVKTKKNIGEIQKFVVSSVETGGGGKIAQKNIPVVEIQNKNKSESGKQQGATKIFRVTLGDDQKKALFSGLAKTTTPVEDMRLDNECPAYLLKTKRQFERISFSLRSKYKESHKIKVKLAVIGLKMRIKLRDKENPNWIGLDDIKAKAYMDTPVLFNPDEAPASGIPTVRDFYAKAIEALE